MTRAKKRKPKRHPAATLAKLAADIASNAVTVDCVRERFGQTYCRVKVNREIRSDVMPEDEADALAVWTIEAIESVVAKAETWRRKRGAR